MLTATKTSYLFTKKEIILQTWGYSFIMKWTGKMIMNGVEGRRE